MAGSPERSVVLRRLGIVKDTDDTSFSQESRASVKPEDALELFAAEHGASRFQGGMLAAEHESPRPRRGLKVRAACARWARAAGVGALAVLRRSAMLGVLAVFAIAMAGGVWLINRLFASPRSTTETSSSATPGAESGTPAESSTSATSGAASKVPGDVVLPAGRRANAARASATAAPGDQQPLQAQSQNTPLPAGQSVALGAQPEPADARTTLQVPFTGVPLSGNAAATETVETIYSAENQDVVPPQTSEQLPGPTISRWTTRTNAMELIVSEAGTVERVRLITPPQRMPDIQILSVAKVWKFTPAMKDGKPVRYRLLLTWEVNP